MSLGSYYCLEADRLISPETEHHMTTRQRNRLETKTCANESADSTVLLKGKVSECTTCIYLIHFHSPLLATAQAIPIFYMGMVRVRRSGSVPWWITGSMTRRPTCVAFAWTITGKHDVIHKAGST